MKYNEEMSLNEIIGIFEQRNKCANAEPNHCIGRRCLTCPYEFDENVFDLAENEIPDLIRELSVYRQVMHKLSQNSYTLNSIELCDQVNDWIKETKDNANI